MLKLDFFTLAGLMSASASLLHIGIIFGGASWYRFFGAGEHMAQMAEQQLLKPSLITLAIAGILALFAAYAWSAAGIIPKLPLLKLALVTICSIYLLRGLAGLILPLISNHPSISQNSPSFWLWSSTICMIFAMAHLKGLIDHWQQL